MRKSQWEADLQDRESDTSKDWELHNRTLQFLDFMYSKPDIESLTQYLATNICPSGEVCRVHVATLHADGNFRTYSHFGYSTGCSVDSWEIPVTDDRPVVDAFRNGRNLLANSDEIIGKYQDFVNIDPNSPWGSSVIIPTKHPLIFGFRRQRQILPQERASLGGYFEIVGKILDLWQPRDRTDGNSSHPHTEISEVRSMESRQRNLRGKPLTARQKQIVALMAEGQTNLQIAQRISFSESLVRQESVVIYAKLGISGRRELIQDSNLLQEINR